MKDQPTETETATPEPTAADRMASAIAKFEGEPVEEPAAEAPPDADAPPAEPEAPAAEEAKPPAPPPEPVLDKETQDKLALISRREKETKQAHAARMAELAEREKQLTEKLAKADTWERLKARFVDDPTALLDHLEIKDPATKRMLAEQLWYSTLGEDAPKEHKQQAEAAKLRAQIAKQERELQEFKQQAEAARQEQQRQAAVANVRSSLETAIKGLPEGKAPLTRAYFAARPDQTLNHLLDATVRVLQGHVQADPDGDPPTPEDIVEMFEKELEEEVAPLRPVIAPPKPAADAAGEPKPVTRTLSSARTAPKTQAKPVALTPEERMERALAKLENRG